MKTTILYLIFATVLLAQSGIIYFLMKTLKNLVAISKDNLTYQDKSINNLSLDTLSFKNSNKKKVSTSELIKNKELISFVFLSETCNTCKEIFNNRHALDRNVQIVFQSNYSSEMDSNVLLSDDAFKVFDIKTTPQLITLDSKFNIKQQRIIHGLEELKSLEGVS